MASMTDPRRRRCRLRRSDRAPTQSRRQMKPTAAFEMRASAPSTIASSGPHRAGRVFDGRTLGSTEQTIIRSGRCILPTQGTFEVLLSPDELDREPARICRPS